MIAYFARRIIRYVVFATLGLASGSALAGTLTLTGNLQPPAPTMPVVFIAPPLCGVQGITPVTYRLYPIHVSQAGVYTFDLTFPAGSPSFYLYENSFDPNNGAVNCVQADNAVPKQIVYPMNPGTTYYLVVFDDAFAQDSTAFSVAINGPGNIAMSVPIPTIDEWGMIILSSLLALGAVIAIRRRRQ